MGLTLRQLLFPLILWWYHREPKESRGKFLVPVAAGKAAEMEREVAYLSSQPSSSTFILFYQSDTLADGGQMSRARDLAKRAVEEFKGRSESDGGSLQHRPPCEAPMAI
jgi:hypothetical protein